MRTYLGNEVGLDLDSADLDLGWKYDLGRFSGALLLWGVSKDLVDKVPSEKSNFLRVFESRDILDLLIHFSLSI